MADFRDTRVSLSGLGAQTGQALAAASAGAVTVLVSGVPVVARVLSGLTVNAYDQVLIQRRGSVYYVTGVTIAAPVAPPPPPPPPPDNTPPKGDPPPAPRPTVRTGTLTCTPVSTAVYRGSVWRSDLGPVDSTDTYQGRYAGSSFGRMTGCAFYGSKPRSIHGATVTKATLHLRRLSSGDFAARTPTLRLLSESVRPGGAPTLNETLAGPALGVGATTTFVISSAWAQAIVDGTRGGIAISISADTPYIRLAGRDSWAAAWVLVMNWRKVT